MKVIISVFLLFIMSYLVWFDIHLSLLLHLTYCLFLILYIIYATKYKYKILTIISCIVISSTIVYYTGSIAEKIYLKIYKPEVDVALFLDNEVYNKKNIRYDYKIQEGLNYEDFKKFNYIETFGQTTHTTKYFSDTYNVVFRGNHKIYFVSWRKLDNNKIYLYFHKPQTLLNN